jgi:hypothetical protein
VKITRYFLLASTLTALGFGGGCSSEPTVCDDALDKALQCGADVTGLSETGEECAAISQCIATCILDADCGEISDAANQIPNDLTACADSCG